MEGISIIVTIALGTLLIIISGILTVVIIKNRNRLKVARLMNLQLEKKIKNHYKIMRIMAHDLRSPLAGITGLSDLLLTDHDGFSDDVIHMLNLIRNTGSNSLHMINDLLDSGMMEEEEVIETEPLNIEEVLTDCIDLLSVRAAEKQQWLTYQKSHQPVVVNLNYQKLWRAFNNILINAIKFSYPDSEIKIDVTAKDDYVQVAIADRGIGIPETDKERVFELFSPAKRTGTSGEVPFGLGLSISQNIIRLHGGSIWFESEVGIGTTFFVQLPVNA